MNSDSMHTHFVPSMRRKGREEQTGSLIPPSLLLSSMAHLHTHATFHTCTHLPLHAMHHATRQGQAGTGGARHCSLPPRRMPPCLLQPFLLCLSLISSFLMPSLGSAPCVPLSLLPLDLGWSGQDGLWIQASGFLSSPQVSLEHRTTRSVL